MASWRWICGLFILLFPLLLSAARIPVIVDAPASRNILILKEIDFQPHARIGDVWVGTMASDASVERTRGVTRLDGTAMLTDLYQTDRRGFRRAPQLRSKLPVLLEKDDWLLFRGDAEALRLLSSAGIPFRRIAEQPLPPLTDDFHKGIDTMHPFVGVILNSVSQASFQNYIQTLQDFQTRNTFNPENNIVAAWIAQTFQSFGLTTTVDTFQIGGVERYNIIADLPGTLHPQQMFYLCAHFDATAGLPIYPEPLTPGADDNGTGAAFVLEGARVLAQYDFENTIRFALFSGNEQGLVGSEAYVSGLPLPGETYLGVFNADMIGWSGADPYPPDLVIYTDNHPVSLNLADKIAEGVSLYVGNFIQPVILTDPTMVYSDHAPFWDAGIPAVLAMEDEAWGDDLNPYYHSVNDLLAHLDIPYAVHAMKAVLAAAADLSLPVGSSEPILTAANPIINDSQGNNNGQIEYGERIRLSLPIINAGGTPVQGVNITLTETDPYINFTDWQETYGLIPALDTTTVPNAFAADVSVSVPDEHLFDITVTMTWGVYSWQSVIQMVAHAPAITVAGVAVNDTTSGNGNGQLEIGESADLQIQLRNAGTFQAANLSAVLSTISPYIIIHTASNNYGTIVPDSAVTRSYPVTALATAPAYFLAEFNLNLTAQGGWTGYTEFPLDVGDLTHLPTGPDNYGYQAYDIHDAPYAPTYEWIEIAPEMGGPGTALDFTQDDQTLYVNLPFVFTYYGVDYTEISICSNGWIACGHSASTAYSNTPIPNPSGPAAMIAPFWDDLSPQLSGSVSVYYDTTAGSFIVEYHDVRDYSPNWAHDTFEVILYDPALHPTLTGDGKILMQYGELDDATSCTAGIENHDSNDGIQYLYNTAYASTASQLGPGMAILFTTGEPPSPVQVHLTPAVLPIQIPGGGGSFNFNIAVSNQDTIARNFDVWCDVRLPNGNLYGPVLGPVNVTIPSGFSADRDRTQAVPPAAPAGDYTYNAYVGDHPSEIWSSDQFNFSKSASAGAAAFAKWDNWGEPLDFGEPQAASPAVGMPEQFSLGQNYPNPFNPITTISYTLAHPAEVTLQIFDLQGRPVAELVKGQRSAGEHRVVWDASGLTSGIYFYQIHTESFRATRKMLLLK
jgi:hypothetical protein